MSRESSLLLGIIENFTYLKYVIKLVSHWREVGFFLELVMSVNVSKFSFYFFGVDYHYLSLVKSLQCRYPIAWKVLPGLNDIAISVSRMYLREKQDYEKYPQPGHSLKLVN